MSTTTVEQLQANAATVLAAVERGEEFVIERGQRPIARLVPILHTDSAEAVHEEWAGSALAQLEGAYGSNEPDYSRTAIIEPNPHYRP